VDVWRPLALLYTVAWALPGLLIATVIFHRSQSAFAENV
jgi:hypothetical protein